MTLAPPSMGRPVTNPEPPVDPPPLPPPQALEIQPVLLQMRRHVLARQALNAHQTQDPFRHRLIDPELVHGGDELLMQLRGPHHPGLLQRRRILVLSPPAIVAILPSLLPAGFIPLFDLSPLPAASLPLLPSPSAAPRGFPDLPSHPSARSIAPASNHVLPALRSSRGTASGGNPRRG